MPSRHSLKILVSFFVLLVAASAMVGCSDDKTTSAVVDPGTTPTGGDNDVFVETQPTSLKVPWVLTFPDGSVLSGDNDLRLKNQAPGDYTISWAELEGWNGPRPASRTETLGNGGNLVFSAIYLPQPGTTIVSVFPEGLAAPWQMTGPGDTNIFATGDTVLTDLTPGTYDVFWNEVEGFETPDSTVATLGPLNPLRISANYSVPDSVLFVNPQAGNADAGWTLSGPSSFLVTDSGSRLVELPASGDYTVVWNEVAGMTTPESQTITVDLDVAPEDMVSLYLNGLYVAQNGTVDIAASVGNTSLPWQLVGPNGTVQDGSGSVALTGMRPGTYVVHWMALDGWAPGPMETMELVSGGTINFNQASEAAISIRPLPAELNAGWQLSGPGGYTLSGNGDQLVTGLDAGSYTLTWNDATNWTAPAAVTGNLTADQGLVFEGTFTQAAHTLFIQTLPTDIEIPWTVTGPGEFNQTGTGIGTLVLTEVGDYTISWGTVAGYMTPAPQTVAFTGQNNPEIRIRYQPSLDLENITAGNFSMGSPMGEGCRSGFERIHDVTLTRNFIMKATEVTNAQYVSLAQWALDQGYITADGHGVHDNLDGSTVQLLDLDDGDQEIFFEDGTFRSIRPQQPVKEVSWYGAVAYCDWLSLYKGLERAYNHATWKCGANHPSLTAGFRLPTEAEWEYACRAGSTEAFANGDMDQSPQGFCFSSTLADISWFDEDSAGWSHDVGQLDANDWGLFDMHGNVQEWCNDWMQESYYWEEPPAQDPPGPLFGEKRLVRGGYFFSPVENCRSAFRYALTPSNASYDVGFRVVLTGE